jgi:putative transposase
MVNLDSDIWHWYHNVSECYYHIQLTVKYRKALLNKKIEKTVLNAMSEFRERYAVEISEIGFDRNHIHILCRFLPKYSAGQVIKIIKSITAKQIFDECPEIKKELWGGEFWTDGYYVATIGARGSKQVIENYIRNQGRESDVQQLRLFPL